MAKWGIDLEQGAKVLNGEKYGDWYRDPWGWPEFSEQFVKTLDIEQDFGIVPGGSGVPFKFAETPHFHPLDVPKSRLGTRPAVVQDPRSRLVYSAATRGLVGTLHKDLPDWVFGWRQRDGEIPPSPEEWSAYGRSMADVAEDTYSLQTDITSFFSSINVETLISTLSSSFGRNASVGLISEVLRTHNSMMSRSGLPQRSSASAFLAQVAVGPIDDEISTALQNDLVRSARRWMDDISVEGSEDELFALSQRIQAKARQAGLEINAAKTHLSTHKEGLDRFNLEAIRSIRVPEVIAMLAAEYDDEPEFAFESDPGELVALERELLDSPLAVPRPVGRAVLRSLRDNFLFDQVGEWIDNAHHFPHLADALSRYFAGARTYPGVSTGLESWFPKFERSNWGKLDWVTAQHALAFAADDLPQAVLVVLRQWLSQSSNVQKVAVAIQRLSIADANFVRSTVSARVDQVSDPQLLRLFALGMVAANADRTTVESILNRDRRNQLTHKFLDDHKWKLPATPIDFDHVQKVPPLTDEVG
ncbi:RNA-directed DNA polymerase [Pseudarthrobacter sp. RMG13]|uniref:RNA-directed DNA polymerase n=1 Tax=Pseudarthrobacter humi TaxID=2952523 RepID=A0ABT1LTD8_9MICC|nr:RNA-directed DNA polymerase [Pseudarthrobacter humi]MCP9001715.1 RNA-directed DNA polymerase [Pseudarthrobacter humi]